MHRVKIVKIKLVTELPVHIEISTNGISCYSYKLYVDFSQNIGIGITTCF